MVTALLSEWRSTRSTWNSVPSEPSQGAPRACVRTTVIVVLCFQAAGPGSHGYGRRMTDTPTSDGVFHICEACRASIVPDAPDTVRAVERITQWAMGGKTRQVDGL